MPERITSLCIVPGMEPYKLLRALMERDKLTPTKLAEAVNNPKVTQPKVYKFWIGETRLPRNDFLQPIARYFGVPLEAFVNSATASACYLKLFSSGQEAAGKTNVVSLVPGKPQDGISAASFTTDKRAPVIEWAQLGVDLQVDNDDVTAEERIVVPGRGASDRCKWVVANFDANSFGFRKGDLIAIEPDVAGHTPVSGALYLFETDAGDFVLGRYRPLTAGNFEAIPNDGPPLERNRHGLTLVGIHMGIWKGLP